MTVVHFGPLLVPALLENHLANAVEGIMHLFALRVTEAESFYALSPADAHQESWRA